MSDSLWSDPDNKSPGERTEDMHHLRQPRGPGKSFVFAMETPRELLGRVSPWTGNPFGREIRKGTGTRNRVEAQRIRDRFLGQIREWQNEARQGSRLSPQRAEAYATAIVEDDERDIEPHGVSAREALEMEMDHLRSLPKSKRPPNAQLRQFERVATRTGYPLSQALDRYLEDRAPGNRTSRYGALASSTMVDVPTAVHHLQDCLWEGLCLQEVGRAEARQFRDFLLTRPSPRSPSGKMAPRTADKYLNHLRGIWTWAKQEGHLDPDAPNPWRESGDQLRRRSARDDDSRKTIYAPEQVRRLLAGLPHGDRMGDALRLAVVTGCRADEVAQLKVGDVEPDGSAFTLSDSKTKSGRRFVPLIGPAQELLRARLEKHGSTGRVFPEWPVRPSSGRASSFSQAFTRHRRQALGPDTDGTLDLHSLRRTWRTEARRAGVPDGVVNDLGGWAGPRLSTSSVYDFGMLPEQLRKAQEQIGERLREESYLDTW